MCRLKRILKPKMMFCEPPAKNATNLFSPGAKQTCAGWHAGTACVFVCFLVFFSCSFAYQVLSSFITHYLPSTSQPIQKPRQPQMMRHVTFIIRFCTKAKYNSSPTALEPQTSLEHGSVNGIRIIFYQTNKRI